MKIVIPSLPPRELSPNYSRYAHWSHRSMARTAWRTIIFSMAYNERNKARRWKPLYRARLKWTFVYKVKRNRDIDNLIAACKCGQDALVQAGIIVGDDSEHLELENPEIIIDKKRAPQTIIELEELV